MQRAAYYVRLWGTDYDDEDGPARCQVLSDDPRANAWSSRVEEINEYDIQVFGSDEPVHHVTVPSLGNWHMPVIDVDVPRTEAVEMALQEFFPDGAWVKSTNNWHYYSETPIKWDEYCSKMAALVAVGIVEEGYYGAMLDRGASFVRMPHIKRDDPSCFKCGRPAVRIPSIVHFAIEEGISPNEYAKQDGTYNPDTNHFACDECYVAIGMPSSPRGWVAP